MSQINYPGALTIYAFGNAPNVPGAGSQQNGSALLVPADGSAEVAVTFPLPFAQTIPKIFVSLADVSVTASYALTVQTDSESLTSFKVYVAGGPAGSTCTVNWQTLGGV